MRWSLVPALLLLTVLVLARADGPRDNIPDKVRPIPPAGIAVSEEDRKELQEGLDALAGEIQELKGRQGISAELLADVEIFHKAVHFALHLDEMHDAADLDAARRALRQGSERAAALRAGKEPFWMTQTGNVVHGYRSRIDGSVQPYVLTVPASYRPPTPHAFRLDLLCHGRNENLTELRFLHERERHAPHPANAFVLHLYGRYCNASRFAGEIDCFEALADVRSRFPIDESRIVMRGFSMGGASCWQFAVHHPGQWAAAAPGAGFTEAAEFLKVFQKEELHPTWYEKKLWHLYDSTDYALNLYNCPTIAYSGEKDIQKQAADIMEKAMKKEGLTLLHLVGLGAGHGYEPKTQAVLESRLDRIVTHARDPVPARILFTTWTLRYNRVRWLTVDELDEHWQRATVDAAMGSDSELAVETRNVRALSIDFGPGEYPLDNVEKPIITLDDEELEGPPVLSDRSWTAHFRKKDKQWERVDSVDQQPLRKRHGLQGPIDDAFMDSFLMVRPTGRPFNDRVAEWTRAEMRHALEQWRKQFRGEARVKDDQAVTDADMAAHNLVLWGDPRSNKVLARLADKLPIGWSAEEVRVGTQTYPAAHHAPVLIYPNPLNPKRYIVLNSGFTYREYDYLNNARQSPKLPDYAVIDLRTPPSTRLPGAIAQAGFFNEQWQLSARPGTGSSDSKEKQVSHPRKHRPRTAHAPAGLRRLEASGSPTAGPK